MAQIFVDQAGNRRGPFGEADVRQLLHAGDLSPSDLAWKDGMASWMPLSTLLSLPRPPALPSPGVPPEKKKSSFWSLLGGVGIAIVMLFAVAAAQVLAKDGVNRLMGREKPGYSSSSSSSASAVRAAPWSEIAFGGLSFDSPFSLEKRDFVLKGERKAQVDAIVESIEMRQGQGKGFMVLATVSKFRDHIVPNLDGAAEGMITETSAGLDITPPPFECKEHTVNGLPARMVSAVYEIPARSARPAERLQMRAVLVAAGQQMAQVVVLQRPTGEAADETTSRILDSMMMFRSK